jgi:hypothetical protein
MIRKLFPPIGSHLCFSRKDAGFIGRYTFSNVSNPSSCKPIATATTTTTVKMDSTHIEVDGNETIDSRTTCKRSYETKTGDVMNGTRLSNTIPNPKTSNPEKKMLKTFPIEMPELDLKRLFKFSEEPDSNSMIESMPKDQLIHVPVKSLQLFCEQRQIPRNSSRTKNQLIEAILKWRSSQTSHGLHHRSKTRSDSLADSHSRTDDRSLSSSKLDFGGSTRVFHSLS